jgi:hypothetical protein
MSSQNHATNRKGCAPNGTRLTPAQTMLILTSRGRSHGRGCWYSEREICIAWLGPVTKGAPASDLKASGTSLPPEVGSLHVPRWQSPKRKLCLQGASESRAKISFKLKSRRISGLPSGATAAQYPYIRNREVFPSADATRSSPMPSAASRIAETSPGFGRSLRQRIRRNSVVPQLSPAAGPILPDG